jgi:hypothetical protein
MSIRISSLYVTAGAVGSLESGHRHLESLDTIRLHVHAADLLQQHLPDDQLRQQQLTIPPGHLTNALY